MADLPRQPPLYPRFHGFLHRLDADRPRYVERVIGSIRRECLDHVIILNQTHLGRMLRAYLAYYHRGRTHLGLRKDAPDGRPACAASGEIIVSSEVGGLHHRYNRQAA